MSSDRPRVATAQRNQVEMRTFHLESSIAADHVARIIWTVVGRMDLTAFYGEIKARGSEPGRPATDPMILLTLWLYATTKGVGSGREIVRLCGSDDAYRWICGGVAVNYHTLNDFRVEHGDKLDDLLVQIIGAMTHQGLVTLERVAQDGTRVRADAGAASFRREETLQEHRAKAREQVTHLRQELAEDPSAYQRARQEAELRAAEARAAAIDRALAEMPAVIEVKRRNKSKTRGKKPSVPRVSTTDPEARVMKMADGGFRPAYNIQLATDVESRVIVGVGISNRGTDLPAMVPMLDDIRRRTGRAPGEYLVDGGYTNLDAIQEATDRGITVYAPAMKPKTDRPRHRLRRYDSPEIAQWRSRMCRTDSRAIYKLRAATAETVNADLKTQRSLAKLNVRGMAKARCHVLINALAYNLGRWRALDAG